MPSRQRWPPISCRGQTSDVLVSNILARSLQRPVTLSDYSLPGRFISDCICFSRQCPSIIRFPLTPCLQANRGAEIRIDESTELSDQITGLAAVAAFAQVTLAERSFTPLETPSPPVWTKAAHCKRRTEKCGHCVCVSPELTPPRRCACDTTSATDTTGKEHHDKYHRLTGRRASHLSTSCGCELLQIERDAATGLTLFSAVLLFVERLEIRTGAS